jgi:methionyl-tRNA synthetase
LEKEGKKERLDTVLYNLLESLRIISVLIRPFMEKTSDEIFSRLGYETKDHSWEESKTWGLIPSGQKVHRGDVLFPRLDIEKELLRLNKENEKLMEERREKRSLGKKPKEKLKKSYIDIDDFDKIDLRIGKVLEVKKHPRADKLLVFKIQLGEEIRQIVSGIAKYYSPEELVGKNVVIVANLKPIKLRGEESQGMILSAADEKKLSVITTLSGIDSGAKVE